MAGRKSRLRKKVKRIIIYTEAFFPRVGGGESYSLDLATTLTSLGYSVKLITPIKPESIDAFPFAVIRLTKPVIIKGFNLNFLEILKILLKNRTSIFHISGPTAIDSIIILLCRMLKIPVVVTFHAQFNSRIGKVIVNINGKLIYPLVNSLLIQSVRDIKFLRGLNQNLSLKLIYFNGVDRQKYNCSAASLLKNSDGSGAPFNFIFIGGISSSRPYKGAENLVSIFKRFFDEYAYENVYITFIGGGDLLPKVRLQAQEYNNIRFKENLSDDLLLYELCMSDVLILPSISDGEGFGRVALEAISCKRAVLVSKFAGISELIEKHKAGLVFDPLDIMDSIDKIKFIIDNRLSLKYYIENASNMIESEGLDLISSTKRTIKIYEEFSTLE